METKKSYFVWEKYFDKFIINSQIIYNCQITPPPRDFLYILEGLKADRMYSSQPGLTGVIPRERMH